MAWRRFEYKNGRIVTKRESVAVVMPTYREKGSVRQAIEELDSSGYVDEIIVVDNNAEEGTREEVAKTRARLVHQPKQGYGHAIRKGIETAKSDLIIITEPDGSFDGRDVLKLLAYSDDFEMVFGSRTHRPLMQKGSDMTIIKHISDVALAKMATWLFLCPLLTDLGCTMRLTRRKAWKKIEKEVDPEDGIFSIKWILTAAASNVNYIQIPISFRARVGKSSLTETFWMKARRGIREFFYVWKMWYEYRLIPFLFNR